MPNDKDKQITGVTKRETCWYWENRRCRYPNNCNKGHPEKCKDMVESGRCYNKQCKLMHPKICWKSLLKEHCDRGESCWFVHPTKQSNQQNKIANNNINRDNIQRHNNQKANNHNRGNQNNLNQNSPEYFLHQRQELGMGPRNNTHSYYNSKGNGIIHNYKWKETENQTVVQELKDFMTQQMTQQMRQQTNQMNQQLENLKRELLYNWM